MSITSGVIWLRYLIRIEPVNYDEGMFHVQRDILARLRFLAPGFDSSPQVVNRCSGAQAQEELVPEILMFLPMGALQPPAAESVPELATKCSEQVGRTKMRAAHSL